VSDGTRTPRQLSGDAAEDAALALLQSNGLRLVQRNYRARRGEIDLVMQDGEVLVYVEVRFRSDDGHGDGLDSVSASKRSRLINAARQYAQEHPPVARMAQRFDVVALGAGGLRWVRNAIQVNQGAW
jgi:putative endonuclease